jgi:hypothetical protein
VKIRTTHKDTVVEIYIGQRRLQSIRGQLESLRYRSGQELDVLASPEAFLTNLSRSSSGWKIPVAVLMRNTTGLYGAVLLSGHTICGVPTGVFKAGRACGRGDVIAEIAQRPIVAEIAARVLRRKLFAHTVAIRLLRNDLNDSMPDEIRAEEVEGRWLLRRTLTCIRLEGGMEALISRLSYKMRRNLRYSMRKAEKDLACVFIPHLPSPHSRQAVQALNGRDIYSPPLRLALRYEAVLRESPGSVAMGLQDSAGNWLSFMAGWRNGGTLYVDWQLNSTDHNAVSISTVMRINCIQHEISQGTREIIFVGGTTREWSRACVPQICGDLLVVRKGIIGYLSRVLSKRLHPTGEIAGLHRRAVNARTGSTAATSGSPTSEMRC